MFEMCMISIDTDRSKFGTLFVYKHHGWVLLSGGWHAVFIKLKGRNRRKRNRFFICVVYISCPEVEVCIAAFFPSTKADLSWSCKSWDRVRSPFRIFNWYWSAMVVSKRTKCAFFNSRFGSFKSVWLLRICCKDKLFKYNVPLPKISASNWFRDSVEVRKVVSSLKENTMPSET